MVLGSQLAGKKTECQHMPTVELAHPTYKLSQGRHWHTDFSDTHEFALSEDF